MLHAGGRDPDIGSEIENELIPGMQDSMCLRVVKKGKRNGADDAVD